MESSRRGMKYGFLIGTVSILLCAFAIDSQHWPILWPALSFGIVSCGYFFAGPKVFGKTTQGRISLLNFILLLPYLAYVWSAWHLLRIVKSENAYDQISEYLFIGRRLTSQECPDFLEHVVDLTCEFHEPEKLTSCSYHLFQILDRFAPPIDQLCAWIERVSALQGNVYIHCAEGHGRTGLFAAALLIGRGDYQTPEAALQFIKSKRPQVRLGSSQLLTLKAALPKLQGMSASKKQRDLP